ncbi:MAG: RluA family pseudouridine synthase [Cytophagales bacterium]|nr:RluA family pseudouridine synthase [Cytophagales bacterium]
MNRIWSFSNTVDDYKLPTKLDYPFCYEPNPLATLASKQLQEYLTTTDWDFSIGKMFGVLVVQDQNNKLHFLTAFSGKIGDDSIKDGFVPPIYNRLALDGFFKEGEEELNELNRRLSDLEKNDEFLVLKQRFLDEKKKSEELLSSKRKEIKQKKKERKTKRNELKQVLEEKAYLLFEEELKKQSMDLQFSYKRLVKEVNEKLTSLEEPYLLYEGEIEKLREKRKLKSSLLQQKLFDQYQFLNSNGDKRGLCSIFEETALKVPPAGAGDCAAPKLFQYAYQENLKPIALAEFWWGTSPAMEVRIHSNYYPACRGKCEPILGHMLEGLEVAENPIFQKLNHRTEILTIYEDEHLAVINKPPELLSIPGKDIFDSVQVRMKKKYPNATGPLLVHRLDMSTSGIMLVAKDKGVHKELQRQFIQREIEKRYVALLDGVIEEKEGIIDLPLRTDYLNRPCQMVCFEKGKKAQTRWELVSVENNRSKVYYYPITGRTHQLRVHSAHHLGMGFPIVGDELYGTVENRLCLHANLIKFEHPITKEIICFEVEEEF